MHRDHIKSFVFVLIGIGILSAGLAVVAEPKPEDKPAAFKPAMELEQLMECQNRLFKEVKDGLLDKKWKQASESAWVLAELANVNQYHNENSDYRGHAKKMMEECVTLAKALKKQDEAASKEAVKSVGNACGACHDQFKK